MANVVSYIPAEVSAIFMIMANQCYS